MYRFTIEAPDTQGTMTYADEDPVKFIAHLRAMYGKRVVDAQYNGLTALYKGNVLTKVTLDNATWSMLETDIVRTLIPKTGGNGKDQFMGRIGSAEIVALHEIAKGGLQGAIGRRIHETGFANVYFEVRNGRNEVVFNRLCQDCVGGFMQWSERGWALCAFQDVSDELADANCDLCGQPLHKEV